MHLRQGHATTIRPRGKKPAAVGPGGVLVFDPDGSHLGTLNTGVATANCGWGDDGSVLYITADMFLCRIRLTTQGY